MCKKLLASFKNSLSGLHAAFKADISVKIECLAVLSLFVALVFLDINSIHKAFMAASLLLVLCVELLNTAIEKLADRFVSEYDIQIKFVKDVASAAVLVSIVIAVLVWICCICF